MLTEFSVIGIALNMKMPIDGVRMLFTKAMHQMCLASRTLEFEATDKKREPKTKFECLQNEINRFILNNRGMLEQNKYTTLAVAML